MTVPDSVKSLVERFDQHREAYRSGRYNETQLRREFLDPFFEALGWDVLNRLGYSEENKHVIHEDSLEIEGVKKAPDYAFKIGKERKFFVEAKKPSVKIETNPEFAFQLRRYVWSAKLPLGILTDFEEFAVYECRSKPQVSDSVKTGRVLLLKYTDYIEKWDEIVSIFSYEAVMKGGFDKFANTAIKKKGTAEVDEAFLDEIEGWRDTLARNIALRNKEKIHSEADLNYAVQMTIDRIIFLRICEDRGFESENQLQNVAKHEGIYGELKKLLEKADRRYNSGLFHFKEEKGRGRADTFTTRLEIDDKVLKDILRDLYYPSPYVFSQIPADILGQIYEQFLGKVIRLTAGGNAKVEEKPEVRKAGGVFYTPTFIVDYIVSNTLGKLLEGKTPAQAALLKIVDPACGSGTFLLGAYQYLLDWHLNWYLNNDFEKWSKGKNAVLVQGKDGWKLKVEKKKEILLNNIYGVDIDPQAVEVTKLSLLLKVIEDPGQLSYLDERILPDLGRNIKCGNSLIGYDYWEGQLMVSEEERERVNAFDWKAEFPQVFAQGGFDAVFGNPPYRMIQPHNTEKEILEYLRKKYLVAEYKMEMFHMFLQLGVSLLRPSGLHGFIVPATILNNVYAEKLRNWIMSKCIIRSISVANEKVFADADVHTLVLVVQREDSAESRKNAHIQTTTQLNHKAASSLNTYNETKQEYLASLPGAVWNVLITDDNANLILRLNKDFKKLSEISTINRGLITGDRDKYFSDKKTSNEYVAILAGSDVNRYVANDPSEYVLFKKPKGSGGSWDADMHLAQHKILVRQIGTKPMASLIREPIAVTGNLFTIRAGSIEEELYILGIFNSKLIEFFWKIMFSDFKSSFPQVTIFSLSQIPIRLINFSDPADKARHDKMVALVERMLALHKSLASTDRQIDNLVYELYGLTEEEVEVVEGN